jgi:hypothetical protein
LVNLPTEILEQIVSHLQLEALFGLATCSQRLFYICRNGIIAHLKSQRGHLAGTSLICVGSNLAAGDYPPGIDWQSKMEELQKIQQRDTNRRRGRGAGQQQQQKSESKQPEMKTLYEAALDFSVIETRNRFPVRWMVFGAMPPKKAAELRQGLDKLPHSNKDDIDFLLGLYYQNGPDWILRNLTNREFVRRSVVARIHERDEPPTSYGAGLGAVLLSRIGWSSDPSTGVYWGIVHRGIWAGHKFDVTLLEAIEGDVGWTDVSDSAYEDIKCMWQSAFGEDWEKVWLRRY